MNSSKFCCEVGIAILQNENEKIIFPTSHQKCQMYDLGFGYKYYTPDEASSHLLKREIPEVHEVENISHEIIFCPESYNNKEKDVCQSSAAVEKIFTKLQSVLQLEKNIVIITGFKSNEIQQEMDFLIISESLKTIIQIEVASTGGINTATRKLEEGAKLIGTSIPFRKEEQWKYIRVLFMTHHSEMSKIRHDPTVDKHHHCHDFILTNETDLEAWWSDLKQTHLKPVEKRDSQTYQRIMMFLLFLMLLQKMTIDTSSLPRSFYNVKQYALLNACKEKRVVQVSPFSDDLPNNLRHSIRLKDHESYGSSRPRVLQSYAIQRRPKNKGKRSLFLAVKEGSKLVSAMDQLVYILENEKSKTIIKIESSKTNVLARLKNSKLKLRLLFEDNLMDVDEFIEKSDKILVVTSKGDTFLKGSDVPVLVVITKYIDRTLSEKIFSRCKSKLVVVSHEEYALRIVPSNETTDYAKLISVYETLMPHDFEEAVKNDNLELLRPILRRDGQLLVDARNVESKTGLMIACSQKAESSLNELVNYFCDKKDLDLYAVDAQGLTAIHYAAKSGSVKCLEVLTRSVIQINDTTKNEALQLAAEGKHRNVIKFLENLESSFIDRFPLDDLSLEEEWKIKDDEMMEYQASKESLCSLQNKSELRKSERMDLEDKRRDSFVGASVALANAISMGTVGVITAGAALGVQTASLVPGIGVMAGARSHSAKSGLTSNELQRRRHPQEEFCILS